MDCKKFIQLVEEKKNRALQKKEASLKWEQKLEAAARAKVDAEPKRGGQRVRSTKEGVFLSLILTVRVIVLMEGEKGVEPIKSIGRMPIVIQVSLRRIRTRSQSVGRRGDH